MIYQVIRSIKIRMFDGKTSSIVFHAKAFWMAMSAYKKL